MATRYDPQAAESRWRAEWAAADLFKAKSPAEAGDAQRGRAGRGRGVRPEEPREHLLHELGRPVPGARHAAVVAAAAAVTAATMTTDDTR